MADSHLRAGNPEEAIDILEDLYAESPDNSSFYRRLKEAYESTKRYEDALDLVDDRIGSSPTPVLLSEKARLLYQSGEEEAAHETWEEALSLAPEEATTYRTVYQTLVDIRQFQRAIEVLKKGRERLDRPALFRSELAYLYGLDGQHREAMREYVSFLGDSPGRLSFVQNRLDTFIRQNEGIQAGIDVLEDAVEESPLHLSYRKLLAWLYMEEESFEEAFEVYQAIDRLQDREGQALYTFAQQASDARQFSVATEAFETVLERYPEAEAAPAAQRALGDLYRDWARNADSSTTAQDSSRYAEALAAYQTFVDSYPHHDDVPQALLDLGTLHLDAYRNLDEAQARLERVVSDYSDTPAADEAQFQLARVALLRDDHERARLLLSRLVDQTAGSELAARARYELARLHFYRGEFEAALSRAEATSSNATSNVANDAIELKVLLQENRGPDSLDAPLRLYAQARLSERQRQYEDALTELDSLLQMHGTHPLADDARFRRAHVYLARGDTTTALETFGTLPEQHPRSPYADRCLYQIGVLNESLGQPTAAVEAYNRLLTNHPTSLLASEVRERIRSLQRREG